MSLGKKIKELRLLKGFSRERFSRMTGISAANILKIENDKTKKPFLETLEQFARILEVPVEELRKEL